MDLTRRYRVSGVPKTIINAGEAEILGAVPEDEFVRVVAGRTEAEPPRAG